MQKAANYRDNLNGYGQLKVMSCGKSHYGHVCQVSTRQKSVKVSENRFAVLTCALFLLNTKSEGKGIAKELVNRTSEIGKNQGCGFMLLDCTSHFTALVAKKLGFELIYSLNYGDYKVNKEVVLKPEPPHTAVTVYTRRIV
ncbi:hypothetical protein JTB14_032286 [Gonioctena quinquepunctata]|nr:hypothetical protein JTB14_032286 [Gonioctena quinquepunctata]